MNAATICLLLVSAVAFSSAVPVEETNEQIIASSKAIVAECSQEHNVPGDYATKLNQSPDTEAVRCFVRCLAIKLNYVNAETKEISVARVKQIKRAYGVPEEVIQRKLEACKELRAAAVDGTCDGVYNAFKCTEKA